MECRTQTESENDEGSVPRTSETLAQLAAMPYQKLMYF